ncbi:ATP-binding protein [Cypionkella sp. TWP1-2-1b2]|uniref:PAS domain-containing hybrid sensor histidine kinase/response regulator n=1 Tax=Cypionkella sp. TWP1-2-1b2 TaxID=2804675 RepID=UPI003CF3FB4C
MIHVAGAAVYLRGGDEMCHLTYRAMPSQMHRLPQDLPNVLVAHWLGGGVDARAMQNSSAGFVERSAGTDRGPEDFMFLPMMERGQCVGAIGYAALGADYSDTAASTQMLRALTDILQAMLVQDVAVAKPGAADLAGTQDQLDALQGYGLIGAVVSRLKDQESKMAALASAAEAAHMRLINAIHALPDGVVIFDAQDRLVAVNAAYHQSFPELVDYAVVGVTLRELLRIGLEKLAFLGETTEAQREAWLQARLLQYQKPRWDDEVQLPDGRWIHRVSTRTADGGVIAMGFDITAKRNQIAALDAANRDLTQVLADRDRAKLSLSGIIDGAAVGTWELVVDTNKIHVGGRWGEILGLETCKLSALSVPDFIDMLHPDDQQKLLLVNDFNRDPNAQLVSTEFRMRHVDGHWVWILSRCRVSERTPDGVPSRISGVHLDISEQKQLEQDVFASRAFLLDVMDASSSAIVVLDGAHRISYVNQEAERILGLICKVEPGEDFDIAALKLEHVDGTALAEDDSPFKLALRAAEPVRNIQCAFLRPDGARGILSFNAALLDMGDQRFGVVSFSDITESLAATQRLQDALMRAEDMSRAKSTFLANMSHEIRTPLNGVLGMAEVLADIVVEPLQRQMVDTIRKSGETLLTVLNGILDMSKIEAGKMVVESVPFVPLEMIRQAESIYAIAAEEKGVAFEVLATAGCDKPRLSDAHRVMQVLNNLLNNAFKFTETGKVTLKFSCRTGKPVQIEVSDTGIGMDASQVSRVFESFEQADGSMTRRFGGTGLGLSIVRELVTLMGGTISAESVPGLGSMFRISLPLPEAETAPATQLKPKEGTLREDALAGVRLLCADDNATNRLVLSEMLVRTGAVVTQVENGREAVEVWRTALDRGEPFALLLLDITMPVLDGMSALAEIRAIEASCGLHPVAAVAVTAHAMPTQIADYLIGGFDSHLAKPFRRADLLHALHSLLQL